MTSTWLLIFEATHLYLHAAPLTFAASESIYSLSMRCVFGEALSSLLCIYSPIEFFPFAEVQYKDFLIFVPSQLLVVRSYKHLNVPMIFLFAASLFFKEQILAAEIAVYRGICRKNKRLASMNDEKLQIKRRGVAFP